MTRARIFISLLWVALVWQPAYAQTDVPGEDGRKHVWQVFLQHNIDTSGTDRLLFIDTFTGDTSTVEVHGERYTPIGQAVMFYNPANRRVMLASFNGTVRQHPFIQPGENTRQIDWLLSVDGSLLAWTLTNGWTPDALTTITTVANRDGTNPRQVLVDGPRNAIRALPVAFNTDQTRLYMDYHPDGVGDFTPFPQYAGLFALDLESGEDEFLPGEPGCFCGAGISQSNFLRLAITSDLAGFDVHVFNLDGQVEQTIPALKLRNYTQAGGILIAPDGSKAVYGLAKISAFGTERQSVEVVFMLVNLVSMTQTPLTDPITTFVRPIAWTDDNSAVLFTSPQVDGTWKVNLADGEFVKVAASSYIGTLYPPR